MTTDVDTYFSEGCGRCKFGGTPQCKVHLWPKELLYLRKIALDCGLTEEMKWGMPCYTHKKKNIVMVGAFKPYCAMSFFKGSLLQDEAEILEKNGENSQVFRIFKTTNTERIAELEDVLKAYIFEAIELEVSGAKIITKSVNDYPVPEELQDKFNEMPELKRAFDNLTPGRQKAYLIHFGQAKQSTTRIARIEKHIPMIFAGKGLNE